MLRSTQYLSMRMAKVRRPRERAWEILNIRDLGLREGSQNFRSWAGAGAVMMCITAYESYMEFQRLVARGDTCEACEAAREQYQKHKKQKQVQMAGE